MKTAHRISYILFVLTSSTMLLLFIWGFLLPPIGQIDQTVIQAGGLLLALASVAQLPHVISCIGENRSIKIAKGDFSVESSHTKKE
jgi:hypothetical protein